VVCVDGLGKLVDATSVWILRNVLLVAVVGQRSGRGPGNKTLLWVVSVCDEYSFDVNQVGDVDT